VAQGRPSSPRGAVWQNLGGLWIERRSQGRPARLGQTSGTGWRRDVLIQLTRNVAEQHLFWLVQVVARRKVDAAETTATPDHRTRATTGPASAAPIDGVATEQHVQCSARPALDRAKPALGVHGDQQAAAQRLTYQLMADLMHAHSAAPFPEAL